MTEHQKNQNTEPGDSEIEVDAAVVSDLLPVRLILEASTSADLSLACKFPALGLRVGGVCRLDRQSDLLDKRVCL